MATFKTLGIKKIERRFAGTKIHNLDTDVIGKSIKILDFEICPSKRKQGSTYVKLQLSIEGKKYFVTTGGKFLQMVLLQVDNSTLKDSPIETRILKTNGYYYFEGTMESEE